MNELKHCKKTSLPEIVGFQLLNTGNKIKPWQYSEPTRGDIGAYGADRLDPWNPFIVIDSSSYEAIGNFGKLKVIFPRIKVADGKMLFGQDKTIECSKSYKFEKCKCPVYYNCDGYCTCGARETNSKIYDASFCEMPKDYEYNVINVSPVGNWFEFFNDIYELQYDLPMSWCPGTTPSLKHLKCPNNYDSESDIESDSKSSSYADAASDSESDGESSSYADADSDSESDV
jgi:hypothetical protein